MWSYFMHKDMPYNLRKRSYSWLTKNSIILLWYKCCSFSWFSHMEYLPAVVKSSDSLFEFKNKIKNIGDIDCGCLICRNIYVLFYFVI